MRRTPQLDALVRRRDELASEHAAAVVKLEHEGAARAHLNRRECNRLYDALDGVQKEIDGRLARERKR